MGAFVTGSAEAVIDAAIEENIVYARIVSLYVTNVQMLDIWDDYPPLSGEMAVGQSYEVVVVMTRGSASVVDAQSVAPPGGGHWQGMVVRPNWRAARGVYHHARPELFAHEWALIETPVGQMLMRPADLPAHADEGTRIRTPSARLDLYAIV